MIKPNHTQARLDALEARSVHQEQTIDELSLVAAKQWGEIADLKDRLNFLNERLQEMKAVSNGSPGEARPPPHY
ncbi:MAG: SlyX family protein [Pseudomonadota bacterium]|nr:SlyX family protein [Pseudomonadota bacterium]